MLGLSCSTRDVLCGKQDLLAAALGLSSCGVRALERTCVLLPRGMWDLSSPTRDQIRVPCIGRRILNHWTTREVLYEDCFDFMDPLKASQAHQGSHTTLREPLRCFLALILRSHTCPVSARTRARVSDALLPFSFTEQPELGVTAKNPERDPEGEIALSA